MNKIHLDKSTGFVNEEELLQLAEPPEGFVGEGGVEVNSTTIVCGITAVSTITVGASAAWGDACPTTACTSRCTSSI
ncbi:class II lanthipeptide, LchA2/BrtA2 family [Nocardiopsis aegyptia]|uniref:Uncharacterized protein n=1 Tax=Nocardiopsis aegyptia TaxID=220378 RepID=A0A7Z0JBA5_9ACTN|nr:class II lanthipeptide, LchA2/BrtA2 family [Nocardiopsis aegyptia]NYJ35612.1 hypothetical protein [Nocardiopsis aegyptia]